MYKIMAKMKMKNCNNIMIHIAIVMCAIMLVIACDRANLHNIADSDSRTAYAIAYNGSVYTLIIANIYFDKQFTSSTVLPNPMGGIAVNNERDIMVYNNSTGIALSTPDLKNWITSGAFPSYNTVLGYHDSFLYFNETNQQINQFDEDAMSWNVLATASTNSLGMFQANNSQIYIVGSIGTNVLFYTLDNLSTPFLTVDIGISLLNPVWGYANDNIFYIWMNDTTNSFFKIVSGTSINLNPSFSIGDSFIDATVTDDDKVFALVSELGNIYLKQIISDGNYPILYNFGTTGTFAIDTLDNNNLIIASYGNTESYNGLFIYNIKKMKIENFITTEDVIALCVPR